jgi:hypothetical protein
MDSSRKREIEDEEETTYYSTGTQLGAAPGAQPKAYFASPRVLQMGPEKPA